MFLYYIIVYSFKSHILKFYEDLVVNLLTKQPSLKKKKNSDLQCKIHLHISLSKYMYVHLFLSDKTPPPPFSILKTMQSSFADKILHMFLI